MDLNTVSTKVLIMVIVHSRACITNCTSMKHIMYFEGDEIGLPMLIDKVRHLQLPETEGNILKDPLTVHYEVSG